MAATARVTDVVMLDMVFKSVSTRAQSRVRGAVVPESGEQGPNSRLCAYRGILRLRPI